MFQVEMLSLSSRLQSASSSEKLLCT